MAAAVRGALVGAAIGFVVAMLAGVVLIGTDDIPDIADREQLPVLYAFAGVVGVVIGAIAGAAGLALAVQVARTSAAPPVSRRFRGALAAAGVSAVVGLLTLGRAFFGPGLLAVLVVGALGGVAAWLLLPSQVDLSAAPQRAVLPARPSDAGQPQMSVVARSALTLVVAGVGSFLTVSVVMGVVSRFTYVERDAGNVLAFGILAVAFVAIAVVVWRHLARRQPRPSPVE